MAFLLALTFCVHAWGHDSEEEMERRITVGLGLFPNIVSIDLDLVDKRMPDGALLLWIVYYGSEDRALTLAKEMSASVQSIQQFPVKIQTIHHEFDSIPENRQPCAVFLLDPIPETSFKRIMNFSIERHFIVFSPYRLDVQRGATIGLKITSKIKPVVNKDTLRKSMIRLHDEFLRLVDINE